MRPDQKNLKPKQTALKKIQVGDLETKWNISAMLLKLKSLRLLPKTQKPVRVTHYSAFQNKNKYFGEYFY